MRDRYEASPIVGNMAISTTRILEAVRVDVERRDVDRLLQGFTAGGFILIDHSRP